MNIKVWDDKYTITSDPRQFVLTESEDENAIAIGYFPTLASVLKAIVYRENRKNKCTTLDGYIKHIEKNNSKLEECVGQISAVIGVDAALDRIMNAIPKVVAEEVDETPKKTRKRRKKKEA